MSNHKISVIMSVHNGMPYLKEAVESILNQTCKDFEFIIVDDASADDSLKYLKSLKDKRIKLIINNKNLGLALSLNKALRAAKEEFIARMDADDASLPQRLEVQLKFMVDHPNIDICGTWVDLINRKGEIIGEKKYPIKNKDIKRNLKQFSPIIHPTFMGTAIFFKELRGYDPKYETAEDYELLIRAMKNYQMANIPKKLLKWRLWQNRRSRLEMKKLDRADLKIKMEALKKGEFGPLYFLIVIKKYISTYMLPAPLKLKVSKILNKA